MLISNTISNAVVPDICDLDELQTGERREGLFTSAMGFMAKLEISQCTLIVGYMISWSGLNTRLTTPQEPDVLHRSSLFPCAIRSHFSAPVLHFPPVCS